MRGWGIVSISIRHRLTGLPSIIHSVIDQYKLKYVGTVTTYTKEVKEQKSSMWPVCSKIQHSWKCILVELKFNGGQCEQFNESQCEKFNGGRGQSQGKLQLNYKFEFALKIKSRQTEKVGDV